MSFAAKNVQFQKHDKENWVVVRGELYNNSGANYHSAVFKMVIFIKGSPPIRTMITVNNFSAGRKCFFEKQLKTFDPRMIDRITRFEVLLEGSC
ncbi:MAG: hypothetical protein PHW54_07180 [Candidatus Omnitrophica bacterium]|nr:hypothetical protein [Candidatus Omnitrophota bacterium]